MREHGHEQIQFLRGHFGKAIQPELREIQLQRRPAAWGERFPGQLQKLIAVL